MSAKYTPRARIAMMPAIAPTTVPVASTNPSAAQNEGTTSFRMRPEAYAP